MLILGLQGSPRLKGNTNYLLDAFLNAAENEGAVTRKLHASKLNIAACIGCGVCEKKGYCAIGNDDMAATVYPLLRGADVVVLASPVYFYNVTAQLKALIDRTQALWARKYKHGLSDPGRAHRKGLMFAVGATRGKNLFDGMSLTARYFFDAVGAAYTDMLGYRRIESMGDIEQYPEIRQDVAHTLQQFSPLLNRKKILFACRENACRSQMASAFANSLAGDKVEAMSAGSQPAEKINMDMETAMAELGFDMAYRHPRTIASVVEKTPPDTIVTMGCGEHCPYVPGAEVIDWDLADPAGQSLDFMRQVRDEIRQRVKRLVGH
ncbi:MAG: NAD(P)H-dependent oxidoreductase [Thermodesulfobacteriota bacterium]